MVYYGNMRNYHNITIEDLRNYADNLKKRILKLEENLETLPKVHLYYLKKGNGLQYYWRDSGRGRKAHYISKEDKTKIRQVANASYIHKVLPNLRKNLAAAESFVKLHSGVDEEDIFSSMPKELQIIDGNLYVSNSAYMNRWQMQEYVRNPYKPEGLVHYTIRGEKVRSKSESMIADGVYRYSLAYLLERPLKLRNGKVIYPDFVILHPETLEEIYWEHFGMMNDPYYASEAFRRIQLLDESGIKLGKNLICTFENGDVPLSSALIDSYIRQFFF